MTADRPTTSGVPGLRLLMVLGPLTMVGLSLLDAGLPSLQAAAHEAAPALLVAGLFYLASHVLRALRLVVLAAAGLGLSIRTVALLHFHTAPVSFIVPFKLGELYRWHQLAWLSHNPVGSLLILLLDRMLDAMVLLVVLAVLTGLGRPLLPDTIMLSGVLAVATVLGLSAVLVLPGSLATVQAYVLQHHSAPRARWALRALDAMRLMTGNASYRLRRNLVLLVFVSAGIWALECAVLLVLAWRLGQAGQAGSMLDVVFFPQAAGGPMLAVTSLYTLVGLVTLMLVWPVATLFYLKRVEGARGRVPSGPGPLAAMRRRRIHLHPRRYTL